MDGGANTSSDREARRRSQAERRAESESRLLRAAAELVVEQGLARTSLAQIGKRAGYSHALVNHRFGSKDELVDRLTHETNRFYGRVARERLAGLSGLEALHALCALYLELVEAPDPLGRVHVVLWSEAVASSAERRPAHQDWDRRLRSVVASLLEDGIADGTVAPTTPVDETALTIVGALRGIALQLLIDPVTVDRERATKVLQGLLQSALEVRGPASG